MPPYSSLTVGPRQKGSPAKPDRFTQKRVSRLKAHEPCGVALTSYLESLRRCPKAVTPGRPPGVAGAQVEVSWESRAERPQTRGIQRVQVQSKERITQPTGPGRKQV